MDSTGKVVEEAARRLDAAGVHDAGEEAERLLAWILGTDRGGVVARRPDPLDPGAAARFEAAVARREARVPFQYITGKQEFRGLDFRVDRRVLVPRPETEELVDAALALPLPEGARVADLGTGSGCIAISLAVERPDLQLFALDRSAGALELAGENAERHGAAGRIRFHHGPMESPPADWSGTLDLVVSNPPYVSQADWEGLEPEVRDHEPREALVPGRTGLEAYSRVAGAARELLAPGGRLLVELGYDSESGAREAVAAAGLRTISVRDDLRGIPRILLAASRG